MAKETGLICTGESVRAFLDNRKSQTRRVCKKQPIDKPVQHHLEGADFSLWRFDFKNEVGDTFYDTIRCPYGQVGDRLRVQEGYQFDTIAVNGTKRQDTVFGKYLADKNEFEVLLTQKESQLLNARKYPYRKTSGRFMYKSLARIWREITGIRIERVQDISEENAKVEGMFEFGTTLTLGKCPKTRWSYKKSFMILWNSLNAERGYSWDKNPWNWVLEVKEISDGN